MGDFRRSTVSQLIKAYTLSVQFVGRRSSESVLCRIGHAYEQATPWQLKHPVVQAGCESLECLSGNLAEKGELLGRFAPMTGSGARSRRTLVIISRVRILAAWRENLAEREESIAHRRVLIPFRFSQESDFLYHQY